MADKVNRLAPTGNMDKDSDVRYVGKGERKGDYIDAKNIQIAQDSGGSAGDAVPTLGTKFGFDLGEVSAQNKKYRVTVDGDATKSHAIKFLSTKRDARMTTGTGADGSVEFNGTVSSLTAAFNASNLASAFTVTVSGNEVTFELTNGYDSYQWYLDSVGTDDVSVICTQEAIPIDLAGNLKDIGSYDLLGDLFVFSTTQDNIPTKTDLEVTAVGPIDTPSGTFVGPLTTLTFNTAHNLQARQWIRITNSDAPWLNGLFVVNAIVSPTQIQIVTDTAWGVAHLVSGYTVGSETITVNPSGIGEIGVAQKDDNTESWTYIRLLRSAELNYVSKYAIDCTFNRDGTRAAGYYTDDYNPPRSFYYYTRVFTVDGALTINNSENIYGYDNVASESIHFSTETTARITFEQQQQNGGNLPVGNIWYSVRLIDQDGNTTEFSQLYGPANVYENNNDAVPNGSAGSDNSIEATSKVNVLKITDYDVDVYSQFELAILQNQGGAFSAYTIGPFLLSSSETIVRHTGFESSQATLDVGELVSKLDGFYPVKAKNIREIDERLVLSNIVTVDSINLKPWAETITHSILRKSIPQKKKNLPSEYEKPNNTFENVGYMMDETYRMGVRLRFKNFGWTDVFWVDDIRIDTNPINTSNPNGNNRRISALLDYDLTEDQSTIDKSDLLSSIDPQNPSPLNSLPNGLPQDVFDYQTFQVSEFNTTYPNSERGRGLKWADLENYIEQIPRDGNKNVFIPHLEFNLDMSYQVPELGNVPLSELVEYVSFVRGIIPNSIVASGFGVLSVEAIREYSNAEVLTGAQFPPNGQLPITGEKYYMEYPFWNGASLDEFDDTQSGSNANGDNNLFPSYPYRNTGYPRNSIGQIPPVFFSENRSLLSLYSNDTVFGDNLTGTQATKLLVTGVPELYRTERLKATDQENYTYLTHFMPQYQGQSYDEYDIDAISFVEDGGEVSDVSDLIGDLFTKKFGYNGGLDCARGPVVKTSNQVLFPGTTETGSQTFQQSMDRGVVVCRLFRDVSSDYPLIKNTSYVSCGHLYKNDSGENEITTSVFGGDTFTCTSFLRTRTLLKQENLNRGQGYGTVFTSQSRVNASMRVSNSDNFVFPVDSEDEELWLKAPSSIVLDSNGNPQGWNVGVIDNIYNPSYSLNNSIISAVSALAYSRTLGLGDYPVRIIYSIKKIEEAVIDSYKTILPLNLKDLDLTFGEIDHHENINGELFTEQARKYQRQRFNETGTLETTGTDVGVFIGDAGVLARNGVTLSSYGTQHKWSCIKGVSSSGKDVLYWFNSENGLMMRFGEDGTRVISDRGMIAFFSNFTKWVKNKHEHAFEQGVRGVWDDRRKEAIWTFTGWRNIKKEWTIGNLVEASEVVTNPNAPSDTYEEFPRFFRCTTVHQSSVTTEPGVGADWEDFWEQIPYTDYNYYSIFTICFNEQTNGFRCFYGHIPKTYLRWQNSFLSSHPVHRNLIFEHRLGEPTTWYGVDTFLTGTIAPKIEDATVEMVVNELPEQSLRGVAVEYLTERAPDRIDYSTAKQRTYDEAAQFEQRDDQWFAPIRNDITDTGDPEGDGAVLSGDYLRVKFTIFGGTYNLLHSIVVKIRDRFRRFNR